jgi:hypothetical protein
MSFESTHAHLSCCSAMHRADSCCKLVKGRSNRLFRGTAYTPNFLYAYTPAHTCTCVHAQSGLLKCLSSADKLVMRMGLRVLRQRLRACRGVSSTSPESDLVGVATHAHLHTHALKRIVVTLYHAF